MVDARVSPHPVLSALFALNSATTERGSYDFIISTCQNSTIYLHRKPRFLQTVYAVIEAVQTHIISYCLLM